MNLNVISAGRLAFLLITHLIFSLVAFGIVISGIVFLIRKPMRRYKPLDLAVFERLQGLPSEKRNRLMLAITYLGKHQFLVPAHLLLIAYFLWIAHESWLSVRVLSTGLSSLALMFVLKWLFARKRPLSPLLEAAKGLSFPSGHAIMSVSFYGLMIYWSAHAGHTTIVEVSLIASLVILILLIGFSRVYLRVHYASDVIAGFIIGLIWLMIALSVVKGVEMLTV